MKQSFSEETRNSVIKISGGWCQRVGCYNKGEECHHRLPNYQRYWKRFALFIQSPFNAKWLCHDCHVNYTSYPELRVTEAEAEVYEAWLKRLQYEKRLKGE